MDREQENDQIRRSSEDLKKLLKNAHTRNAQDLLREEEDNFLSEKAFSSYMRELIRKKGIRQQDVFLLADIPERYGYKLISEEKHTRQRDVILRICYAAGFSLAETQKALRIYGMPELYARQKRDALLMIAFNEHTGSIIEVNAFLKENDMAPLRTSGTQE